MDDGGRKGWAQRAFGLSFVLSMVLLGRILWPFAMPVLLGGVLAACFAPVQEQLGRRLRIRGSVRAAASTALVFLAFCVPIVGLGTFVVHQLLDWVESAGALLTRADLSELVRAKVPAALAGAVPRLDEALGRSELLSALSSGASVLSGLLTAGGSLALDLLLTVVAMYYFFLDGRRLVGELGRLLPLEARDFAAFVSELQNGVRAILYGSLLTSAAQGVAGFFGVWLAGVPRPAVWAVAMAAMAPVPLVGTALVWAPLGLMLISTGKVWEGGFLLLWGAVVVSGLDNLLRPRLCAARMAVHPLLIFLSTFGGLAVFGTMGLLIGPLVAALFMAMVRIYRRDFLEPKPAPPLAGGPSQDPRPGPRLI